MIRREDLKLDAHTHTLVSGHAYSTIREMVLAAKEAKLELLCITDHTARIPGACDYMNFYNLKVLPRELFGIEVYFGAENNIIDYEGSVDFEVDVDSKYFQAMDINIASMHIPCYTPGTIDENTNAIIKCIENKYIDIIGHPDDARMPLNYEQIVKKAKEYDKLIEINNHSLDPCSCRYDGAIKNDMELLALLKENQCKIIVDTDSHSEFQIGNFDYALALLNKVNFPKELVVNIDIQEFKKHMNLYRNIKKV